jgi:hypothetical protein
MGGQPATSDTTSQAPPAPRGGLRPVWAGVVSGLCGGVLAGIVGAIINDVGGADESHILHAAAWGAGVVGVAGAVTGALAGMLAGRRGGLAPYLWPATATFWAGCAAMLAAAQPEWLNAVGTFVVGTALLVGLLALGEWLRPTLWKARWLFLGWLALCLAGEGFSRLRPPAPPQPQAPNELTVELHSAPLPGPLGYLARHHFFVVFEPAEGRPHRWDLWQHADAGGESWGHVHRDLLSADAGVGGGPPRLERRWTGDEARALLAALGRSAEYPYRGGYFALPGPNCNTYVAWVLREAGVSADLDPRALGKDYLGPVGVAYTTTGTGVQAESTLLGAKVGPHDGVELHLVTFTFGVDAWPPAVKTPLGRVGFDE